MMKKLFLILFACIVAGKVTAQNDFARSKTDSLQKVLSQLRTGHDSLLVLQKMIDFTPIRADETALYPDHYTMLLRLNRELKLIDTVPYVLMQKGNLLWGKREYRESLVDFQK